MPIKDYRKRNPKEKKHSSLMADALRKLEFDVLSAVIDANGLPEDWQQIVSDPEDTMVRDKITMRLDRDIVRFFKAMGPGYQIKMARVLRAWVHGRLAKVVAGPDTTDIVLRADAVADQVAALPYWGEDGVQAGVQRFVEGVRFYQKMNMARAQGEPVPKGKAFEAAVLEAALRGLDLEE